MHNRTAPVTGIFLAALLIIALFAALSNATGLISFDQNTTGLQGPANPVESNRSNNAATPLYTDFYQVTGSWSADAASPQRSNLSSTPLYTDFNQVTGSWRE